MPDHGEIWVPTPREQSCRSLANMFLIFETSSVIEGFALRYGNAATQLIPMYIYHETGQRGADSRSFSRIFTLSIKYRKFWSEKRPNIINRDSNSIMKAFLS